MRRPPYIHTTEVFPYFKWFEAYMSQKPIKYIDKMIVITRHRLIAGRYGWIYAQIDYRIVE